MTEPFTPMSLDYQKIMKIWSRLQNIPYIFDDYDRGNQDLFMGKFFRPDTVAFEIGDCGLIYFTEVNYPKNANGHIVFWDRRFRERVEVARMVCAFMLEEYEIHRITALIPIFNRAAILFTKRVGFKLEGIAREVTLSLGKWHDVALLSLLGRDLNGTDNSGIVQLGSVNDHDLRESVHDGGAERSEHGTQEHDTVGELQPSVISG